MKLPFLSLLMVALTATSFSTAKAADTDLIGFKGSFKKTGRSLVETGSGNFHGQSARLKFKTSAAGVPATLTIVGSVTSGGRNVPVNNQIKFLGGGRITGTNLLPGVTTNFAFKGKFAAAPTEIGFNGKFKSGQTTGTYNGKITLKGTKLTVAYQIIIGTNTQPSYLYQYSAKR